MPTCKLTKRIIDTLPTPVGRDEIWWDEDLKGFGLKITLAGRKVFLVQYRPAGDRRNPRKYTIGEYGATTPHKARVEAQRVLAERAAGRDPQAEKQIAKRRIASEQVADLAAEFIARHASQNRTAAETTRILNREVLPYWGSWTVAEVRQRDVIALLDRVSRARLTHYGKSGAGGGSQVLQLVHRTRHPRCLPLRRGRRACPRAGTASDVD